MAKLGEVFTCKLCGNEVTVTKAGSNPEITCCGQAMEKKKQNRLANLMKLQCSVAYEYWGGIATSPNILDLQWIDIGNDHMECNAATFKQNNESSKNRKNREGKKMSRLNGTKTAENLMKAFAC